MTRLERNALESELCAEKGRSETHETYFKGRPNIVGDFAGRTSGTMSVGDWLRRRPDDLLERPSKAAGGRRGGRRGLGVVVPEILGDEGTERIDGYALWYISFEEDTAE